MINNSLISNIPSVYKFPQLSDKCFSTVGLFKLGFKKIHTLNLVVLFLKLLLIYWIPLSFLFYN